MFKRSKEDNKNFFKLSSIFIAMVVFFILILLIVGSHQRKSFSTDSQNDVAMNKVSVESACQNPSSPKQQHFLVNKNDEYYLINYTGHNGDSAVEGSKISFKGQSDGDGSVTDSLINMGMDSDYEGLNVEIVEVSKNNLYVNKE